MIDASSTRDIWLTGRACLYASRALRRSCFLFLNNLVDGGGEVNSLARSHAKAEGYVNVDTHIK